MKEIVQMNKRRRVVYFIKTENTTTFATFCVKYLTCLLQTLMHSTTSIKPLISGDDIKEQDMKIRERVRFEIDMAMVVSVGTRFKWTKALKRKLDACQWQVPMMSDVIMAMPEHQLTLLPNTVNHLNVPIIRATDQKNRRRRHRKNETEEVWQCIEMLRELVLLGGDADEECCSMEELVEEVVSYVTCLQVQVAALRCLLSSGSGSGSDSGSGLNF